MPSQRPAHRAPSDLRHRLRSHVSSTGTPPTVHVPAAAYTHQIEVSSDERLLVLSGQLGMRSDGSVPDDPIEQLDVALTNVERNLAEAGMGLKDLVKLTFLRCTPR